MTDLLGRASFLEKTLLLALCTNALPTFQLLTLPSSFAGYLLEIPRSAGMVGVPGHLVIFCCHAP
jgi:hypothetical protein